MLTSKGGKEDKKDKKDKEKDKEKDKISEYSIALVMCFRCEQWQLQLVKAELNVHMCEKIILPVVMLLSSSQEDATLDILQESCSIEQIMEILCDL